MKDIHVFTSHFYSTLEKEGPPAVASWTKKRNINVFAKKFIFIPGTLVSYNIHVSSLSYIDNHSTGSQQESPLVIVCCCEPWLC